MRRRMWTKGSFTGSRMPKKRKRTLTAATATADSNIDKHNHRQRNLITVFPGLFGLRRCRQEQTIYWKSESHRRETMEASKTRKAGNVCLKTYAHLDTYWFHSEKKTVPINYHFNFIVCCTKEENNFFTSKSIIVFLFLYSSFWFNFSCLDDVRI